MSLSSSAGSNRLDAYETKKLSLSIENKNFLNFEDLCKKIESKLQALSPLYKIEVGHIINEEGVIAKSLANLRYDNCEIFHIDTSIAYNRYDGSNFFTEETTKTYFSQHSRLEETVRLNVYASRYLEVVEERIKSIVAKNELAAKKGMATPQPTKRI